MWHTIRVNEWYGEQHIWHTHTQHGSMHKCSYIVQFKQFVCLLQARAKISWQNVYVYIHQYRKSLMVSFLLLHVMQMFNQSSFGWRSIVSFMLDQHCWWWHTLAGSNADGYKLSFRQDADCCLPYIHTLADWFELAKFMRHVCGIMHARRCQLDSVHTPYNMLSAKQWWTIMIVSPPCAHSPMIQSTFSFLLCIISKWRGHLVPSRWRLLQNKQSRLF